jgi:hypothetical protein
LALKEHGVFSLQVACHCTALTAWEYDDNLVVPACA